MAGTGMDARARPAPTNVSRMACRYLSGMSCHLTLNPAQPFRNMRKVQASGHRANCLIKRGLVHKARGKDALTTWRRTILKELL